MRELTDEEHDRLWRLCDALLVQSGARAAMLCDAGTGNVMVSVGDAQVEGRPSGLKALAPGERIVHGPSGNIYGVDLPGGLLLALLHDPALLEQVRTAASRVAVQIADSVGPGPERKAKAGAGKSKARPKKRPGLANPPRKKRKPLSLQLRRRARRRSTRT